MSARYANLLKPQCTYGFVRVHYRKFVPFLRGKGVLHSKQNGSANGALTPTDTPRLSSIYDIRHKNHKEQYQHQQPGFHPPVKKMNKEVQ